MHKVGLLVLAIGFGVGCEAPVSPDGALSVEFSQIKGVWFDIAHLDHPLQEDCTNTRSLYRESTSSKMTFLFECQLPDLLWYTVGGTLKRHSDNSDLLVFEFESGDVDALIELSYWVLAADFEAGWMAVGNPDEDWFWLLTREPSMDSQERDSVLEAIDARELYGATTLLTAVEITLHDQ